MIKVLYFGRVADAVGAREQRFDAPAGGCTVAALKALVARDESERYASLNLPWVRSSVDQRLGGDDAWVAEDSEVAFFSPYSGG